MNIDGRVWFYIPVTQVANIFPYFSEKVVRGIIERLISEGYLVKDHKSEGQQKFNRTNWYSFTNAGLVLFELPAEETPFAQEGKSIVSSNNCNNISTTQKESNKEKVPMVELPYEGDDFVQTWLVLVQQPKWKKKSADALAMSAKMLGQYPETIATEMMRNSIRNGWQGLFPLKPQELAGMGKTSSAQSRAHDARVAAETRLVETLAAEGRGQIDDGRDTL